MHVTDTEEFAQVETAIEAIRRGEEIAEAIKTQMGQNPEITNVMVKGHLLQLHVTEAIRELVFVG